MELEPGKLTAVLSWRKKAYMEGEIAIFAAMMPRKSSRLDQIADIA